MNERNPGILAVETSGRIGGVALASGRQLISTADFQADHNHAVELIPTIARLCAAQSWSAADIQEVYISIGPGSFTGLRIAVTVARSLALSVQAAVVAVPTLEVIARNALDADPALPDPATVAVILDAKRGEIYAAAFEIRAGTCVQSVQPQVADALRFLNGLPQPLFLLGEGISYHQQSLERIAHQRLPERLWRAQVRRVHELGWEQARRGEYSDPRQLTPLYLRRPEAEEVWERRQGGQSEGAEGMQPTGHHRGLAPPPDATKTRNQRSGRDSD